MPIPFRERDEATIKECVEFGPFSRRMLFRLVKEGKVESRLLGHKRWISIPSFLEYKDKVWAEAPK